MRLIRIFILRLMIDYDGPEVLRGVIRDATGVEEHAFADAETLVALLRHMTRPTPQQSVTPAYSPHYPTDEEESP